MIVLIEVFEELRYFYLQNAASCKEF